MTGRAWFPIDVEALVTAQMAGIPRDLSNETPPGMKQARLQVTEMIAALGLKISDVILMGFSQGAMLATMVSLYSDVKPRGLILFSASLLDQSNWRAKAPKHAGMRFFQSHGTRDDLLGIDGARKLNQLLTEAGWIGELQEFDGGHEIPQEVLYGTSQYVKSLFSN
jgi:phospholipase/carboxylesterase